MKTEVWKTVLFYAWAAVVLIMIFLGSDGTLDCNPEALSVFTDQRECHSPRHYPRAPRGL